MFSFSDGQHELLLQASVSASEFVATILGAIDDASGELGFGLVRDCMNVLAPSAEMPSVLIPLAIPPISLSANSIHSSWSLRTSEIFINSSETRLGT